MDSFGDERQLLLNTDEGKFTDILLLDMIKVVTINKLNVKKIKLKRYDELLYELQSTYHMPERW